MNPFLSSLVKMEQTQGLGGSHFPLMRKDTQFTFRITAALKKEMQNIAEQEGRSMAQICEVFLMAGSEGYKKGHAKFLQRFLTRRR